MNYVILEKAKPYTRIKRGRLEHVRGYTSKKGTGKISFESLGTLTHDVERNYEKETDAFVSKIRKGDQEILDEYIGNPEDQGRINFSLRSKNPDPKAEKIADVFSKVAQPTSYDWTVYRGMSNKELKEWRLGTQQQIVSTSLDPEHAVMFIPGDGAVVQISIPKGTKIVYGMPDEYEIILPPGTKFVVPSSRKILTGMSGFGISDQISFVNVRVRNS